MIPLCTEAQKSQLEKRLQCHLQEKLIASISHIYRQYIFIYIDAPNECVSSEQTI